MNNDRIKSKDNVKTELTADPNAPQYVEVEVLAESGIFKNGVQYDEGSKAIITAAAAEAFVANGDVEVIGEAVPPEVADE